MKPPQPASNPAPLAAIACGGTGGHLFPGLAIAEVFLEAGWDVLIIISEKEIDQRNARPKPGLEIMSVPAVGLTAETFVRSLKGVGRSVSVCRERFKARRPAAVLAMGGFTSAGPVVAARSMGVPAFLHEANSIPGRANRWLAPFAREAYVGFPEAVERLRCRAVAMTGTPVRPEFTPRGAEASRMALGLDPDSPTLLVMGGSQGAGAINAAFIQSLPELRKVVPALQYLCLTGASDAGRVSAACKDMGARAVVRPFLTEMDAALGAASLAISRAGASSLSEFAAMRVPAILVPYPSAADNHQFFNARAFAQSGAARMILQSRIEPSSLVHMVQSLLEDSNRRRDLLKALEKWSFPDAARQVATRIALSVGRPLELPEPLLEHLPA